MMYVLHSTPLHRQRSIFPPFPILHFCSPHPHTQTPCVHPLFPLPLRFYPSPFHQLSQSHHLPITTTTTKQKQSYAMSRRLTLGVSQSHTLATLADTLAALQ